MNITRCLPIIAALVLGLVLQSCDLSKSEEDTILPPSVQTPLVVPSVRSLGDGASVELLVTVYGGAPPYVTTVLWGDGASETLQGVTASAVHVYSACGVDGSPTTGWTGTAQSTDVDGRQSAAANFRATPCL